MNNSETLTRIITDPQHFVSVYNKAVEDECSSFIYEGLMLRTPYVTYVIEYFKEHLNLNLDYTLVAEEEPLDDVTKEDLAAADAAYVESIRNKLN